MNRRGIVQIGMDAVHSGMMMPIMMRFDDATKFEVFPPSPNNGVARRIVIQESDASVAPSLADPSLYLETLRCLANHDCR